MYACLYVCMYVYRHTHSHTYLLVCIYVYILNIQRVLKRQASDPVRYQTFRDLLQHEIDTEMTRDYESATLSLLWLKR